MSLSVHRSLHLQIKQKERTFVLKNNMMHHISATIAIATYYTCKFRASYNCSSLVIGSAISFFGQRVSYI